MNNCPTSQINNINIEQTQNNSAQSMEEFLKMKQLQEDQIDYQFIQRIIQELTQSCALPLPIPASAIPPLIIQAAQYMWQNCDFCLEERYFVIKNKDFKSLILYLEGFHFAYNALLSRRSNVLDSIYSNHARAIRKCNSCEEIKKEIIDLRAALDDKYPSFQDFKDAFVSLSFSKKDHPDNLKVRYVINKLNCYYSQNGQEVFSDDGSIEHIISESADVKALNIGNLILLERSLNENADNKEYAIKKREEYSKSAYKWIKDFINENEDWKIECIDNRAENMADVFYNNILI